MTFTFHGVKSRTFASGVLAIGAVLLGGASSTVLAQPPPPVMRADLAGSLGWLSMNKEIPGPYQGDDRQDSLFGAVSAGWYWTDHLKTEVDFGAGSRASAFRGRPVVIDGSPTYEFVESTFSRRALGVSQQYQFFRNAWFHPHVAAGVDITWERTTDHTQPIVVYDDRSRSGRVVQPERTDGPRTDTTVRPFFATGFKAYMTQRGFFRSDLRLAIRDGVDDVLLRFGFGIDF